MNYVMLIEQEGRQNAIKLDVNDNEPVIVGRSWQCDVVVIDQYVDAEHLKISANDDSQISIEDLQSENGTRLERKSVASPMAYTVGDEIVVGETTLRIINADSEVKSAVKYENFVKLSQRFNNLPCAVIATISFVCMMLAFVYWLGSDYVSRPNLIEGGLTTFGFILGWSLVGGLLSKLARGKTFFYLHWTLFCALFSINVALQVVDNFISFNLGSRMFDHVADHLLAVATATALVYGVLTLISRLDRKKKMGFTAIAIATMLFFDIVKPMLDPEHLKWTSYANVRHSGQPPAFFIGRTQSIDEHFEKMAGLFDNL